MPAVANLLQGFVTPTMVRDWYERYCEVNGLERSANSKKTYKRMPMPPIDFQAIEIKKLEDLLELPPDEENEEMPEPEW